MHAEGLHGEDWWPQQVRQVPREGAGEVRGLGEAAAQCLTEPHPLCHVTDVPRIKRKTRKQRSDENKAYKERVRDERRREGRCIECGVKVAEISPRTGRPYVRCATHRGYQADYDAGPRTENRQALQADGRCGYCGRPSPLKKCRRCQLQG